MPGKGVYTQYVPTDPIRKAKSLGLQKLFPGGDASKVGSTPPFYNKEQDAAAAESSAFGNQFIYGVDENGKSIGPLQGDASFFPNGFSPDYSGVGAPISIPNKWSDKASDGGGAWGKSGDPGNPFVPDLTSPAGGPGAEGDGSLDVIPVANVSPYGKSNPEITIESVKPLLNIEASDNTRNPSIESKNIHTNSRLGGNMKLGTSYPGKNTYL